MAGQQRRAGPLLAVAVLLGVAVAGLLSVSPRHRELYLRFFSESPPVPEGAATPAPAQPPPPSAPVPASTRPAPRIAWPDRLPGLPVPRRPVPRSEPARGVVVPVVEALPGKPRSAGAAPAWSLKEFAGEAQVEIVRENGARLLRLVSRSASFALYRGVAVNLKEFPVLTWRWKVVRLPTGGDIRERASDDQAAQVYLVFPRWPAPRANSDVIGYIWDSRAPVGTKLASAKAPNVKVVVLQSGGERVGQWTREERNVHRDYVEIFNREPPRVGVVVVMVDSDDTGSHAEALIDDLVFLRDAPTARP